MNHYSAFLRPYHSKSNVSTTSNSSSSSISSSSSSNIENDENSTIKNLIFKHLSKPSQPISTSSTTTTVNMNNKATMRGILGEVGNMTLSNKSLSTMINKPKPLQQRAMVNIKEAAPAPVVLPVVVNKIEEMISDEEDDDEECAMLNKIPFEFDCDSGDLFNITTVSEYVIDICKYWRELEQNTPIRQNFLLNRCEGTASPHNRAVLIDWLYQVHDRFKLLSDTFHMTIQLIDRYLQVIDVSKHELQLIGSTALLLACKYEEMTIPGMNDFVYVSDNAYSKEDMKDMERRMVSTLAYELGRPLSLNFLRRYSKIVQATDIEHTLGKYLLDLTFVDHGFVHLPPSYTGACASFLSRYLLAYKRLNSSMAMNTLVETLWPNRFMHYHTDYTFEQLRTGIEQLGQLLIGQDVTKLKSVQKKFAQNNMFSVATHSCCKSAYVQIALARLPK